MSSYLETYLRCLVNTTIHHCPCLVWASKYKLCFENIPVPTDRNMVETYVGIDVVDSQLNISQFKYLVLHSVSFPMVAGAQTHC